MGTLLRKTYAARSECARASTLTASSGGARSSLKERAADTFEVLPSQCTYGLHSATALACPNEPHADGIQRQLYSIPKPQLLENVVQVCLDRALSDTESFGYLRIA